MMTLNGYYSLLIRLIKLRMVPFNLILPVLLLTLPVSAVGQSSFPAPERSGSGINQHQSLSGLLFRQDLSAVQTLRTLRGKSVWQDLRALRDLTALQDTTAAETGETPQDTTAAETGETPQVVTAGQGETTTRPEFPDPESVLYKSLIIPGWGQIVNRQAWKIPLIYGLFGGLGYVTHTLTQRYHDYRAAYYNRTRSGESDFRYGPTPSWIPENVNIEELRSARNNTRNQRDTMFIVLGLAYGLNALDAYVYAHMRSFDVSDDLSARATVAPVPMDGFSPGIRVRVQLINKR